MTTDNAIATWSRPIAWPRQAAKPANRPRLCGLTLLAVDCLAFATATALATLGLGLVRQGPGLPAAIASVPAPLDVALLFVVVIGCFALKGRYSERTPFWTETGFVVRTSLFAAAAEPSLGWIMHDFSRAGSGLATFLIFAVLAPLANCAAKRRLAAAGHWALEVLVIGDGPSATEAQTALESDRSLGYRFVGRIDPVAVMSEPATPRLGPLLDRYGAQRLLIAVDSDGGLQRQITECALRERVPFAVVPAPHAFPAFGCEPTRVFSHNTMFLSFRDRLSRPASRILKATFDILIAAAAIVLLGPLLLGLTILCRLDGGPAFFAQWRIGAQGRLFRCLKFRTMVVDADRALRETLAANPALAAEWAANRKFADDPRITRVGRFLRKSSLDELPQLFNVLRLDMSLVGPRPIVEAEVPLYGEHIAQYYAARPGLTGVWQVSGRNDTSYERRVQLDVWYVNNWSIWLDAAVLLKTIPAVACRRGAY